MRFSRSAIAAGLATAATFMAADASSSSDVLDLGKDNFTSIVSPEPLMLVEFFAPWCGHCKALAPEYEKASTELVADGIKLAKVDCTEENELCAQHGVEGFPTLKVFRSGSASDYNGNRKADGIVSYMKKQALPALSTVSADSFAEFKAKDRVVAVAFLDASDDKNLAAVTAVANNLRDNYLFGVVNDAVVAKDAGVSAPAFVVYRQFDEPEVKLDAKTLSEEAIHNFLKAQSIPLIDELSAENFMNYAEAGLPLAYLFADPEAKDLQAQVESLKPLAKANKGKLNFVWIDAVKYSAHAKSLNIQGETWPAFAVQDIEQNLKYPLEDLSGDLVAKVSDFVAQYSSGSLKPSVKSEPVPKDQDGPVHVLVADEFDAIIGDDSKDKLVEFYAPWCGHCKKLAPTYDQLGEKYKAHKDKVLIAKMDATANDIPPSAGFQVQSFPTIKFQAAGSKDWIEFTGDRSLEGFADFIALNGKHKVSIDLDPINATGTEDAAPAKEAPHHEEL
ncbi:protein disulfide isomerase [Moesziomyces antarcticus]|uniref:Protein disulfide-isomerase n=2 Tax=Pseudozyma antarctica TaxID=84753 RepID=A0A081CEH0_PSEA2|nr:protein disulfide isomerase [Moesziomyces antarcticus]GAK65066.1 protein disulfide isomerase [Moesziomyces antarcticus]SPO45941.1 probable proteine disulfate isomerase [Moesziomyces antarcticus]